MCLEIRMMKCSVMNMTVGRNMMLGLILTVACTELDAAEYKVRLPDVASTLVGVKPGDRIMVEDGIYADMPLKWIAKGSIDRPIRVEALHPGKVIVTGNSSLSFGGTGMVIQGLCFMGGHTDRSAVVEFRAGKTLANDCRLTQCVIDNYNPVRRDKSGSYVHLYGRGNRVDHCSFTGKLNLGVTMIVMLSDHDCIDNHHRIDHNYFGPRPVYGSNGAETIRVGTSQQAMESSRTLIEDNVFERCNGEVEVVSIKSSDNVIRNNTLYECQGIVALRHGNRNVVCGNVFIGHQVRNTGGVRVINEGHIVERNLFVGLAGRRFFSAFSVMDGVPHSLPNRYNPVKDVIVRNNIFQDCSNVEFGTGKDLERTACPRQVLFKGNMIINKMLTCPYVAVDTVGGIMMENNICDIASHCSVLGFENKSCHRVAVPDYQRMMQGVGADWFHPVQVSTHDGGVVVRASSVEALQKLVGQVPSGSTILLSGGVYRLTSAIQISRRLTIIGESDKQHETLISYAGEKPDNMMTIRDGGMLFVKHIHFSGCLAEGKALAKAGISTDNDMIKPYMLAVDSCEFSEFQEGGFYPIRGLKSTFADSVSVRHCLFRDLSGDAINYAAENDDMGRYSADDIVIEDCSFIRLLGSAVNIYRGGSDESTAGPYVYIRRCYFEDCCNKERGSVLRLIGPQILSVDACDFGNSGRGGVSVRLDEATWEDVTVSNCRFWNSGRVLTMTGKVMKNCRIMDIPFESMK